VWTVVYVALNRTNAEMIGGILGAEGLLVMLRSAGIPHFGDGGPFEVLVPESEAELAHEILNDADPA
jgi:hypothetical protein